jgi:hypothetical protein
VKTFIRQWFTPRSDDPDLVFREKTLRLFLGVIIPFGMLIFAVSFSLYGEFLSTSLKNTTGMICLFSMVGQF